MSRTNKKMSKQDFPATQPAKMPDWATSIFSTEEAMELTRALEETPLPQRVNKTIKRSSINKQTNNTSNTNSDQQQGSSGLQNPITPSNSNTSLNPTNNNNNNTNTDNNNDNNTGDRNQLPLTYGSSISGITSYKNNLLLTLLGESQHQTINNSPSTEANITEHNSPVVKISSKLKTFVNSLKPSINSLCSTAVTIKTIGSLLSNGNIPQGCTPVCRLGITNPPVTLTRQWNDCLIECGCQFTAILINHHSECHQNMLKDIKLTINTEFQPITSEFQATVPELQSKLKFTESEITQLIETTEQQILNQRKRNNPDDSGGKPASKKPRNTDENDNSSTISEQVQSAIAKALGNITRPNFRGRSRGRDGRGGPPRYFQ